MVLHVIQVGAHVALLHWGFGHGMQLIHLVVKKHAMQPQTTPHNMLNALHRDVNTKKGCQLTRLVQCTSLTWACDMHVLQDVVGQI